MDQVFLENLLKVAQNVTRAERGLVVDQAVTVLHAENFPAAVPGATDFDEFAVRNLKQALAEDEAVLANNVIQDISEAPTTNTNFADLRIVVALPVAGHGAVYLDRHIREGVIPKRVIDQLMRLIRHVLQEGLLVSSASELMVLYDQLSEANTSS